MIEAQHLTKDYGTVVAVKDISFRVDRGEVVGFLGPNGAGKSTTLRMLAGFLGATRGSILIDGHDILEEPIAARQSLGYMPELSPLYPDMRVSEYLRFRAELKRVPAKKRAVAVDRAMELAVVGEMRQTQIGHLSKGYRQRVGLADALVANPPLLILDEPTAGLDPNQIREVRGLIKALGQEHTILLSTHILPEVEGTCGRAIVIDRGRLVAEGSLEELRAQRRGSGAQLVVRDTAGVAGRVLAYLSGISVTHTTAVDERGLATAVDTGLFRIQLSYAQGSDAPRDVLEAVVSDLVKAGVSVREASEDKASLEDVFAQLTRADAPAGEAPP